MENEAEEQEAIYKSYKHSKHTYILQIKKEDIKYIYSPTKIISQSEKYLDGASSLAEDLNKIRV